MTVVWESYQERSSAHERMQAMYDAHAKALYRYLLRLTFGERQAAEDLLQETFLRAWRHLDDLNADVNTLRPWLFTVARRISIDSSRARLARPSESSALDVAAMPASDDAIEGLLAAQTIRQALSSLSADHRSVIVEIYFNGRSARETAEVLGIPEGTVKSRTYHALRRLRKFIAPNALAR
jgi:RNA polymerase sigma-70 factor (ECF subfamily)